MKKIIMLVTTAVLLMPVFAFGAVTVGSNKEILVNGKAFFPIMQWAQSRGSMATQKQYGFNTFVGQGDSSTALQWCDAARAQGMYGVPSWNSAQVDSVKNHEALMGWVFGDEPDLQSNAVLPSAIQTQYDDIKSRDPGHLAFLTLTAGFYSELSLPAWMSGSDANYYEYPKYADCIGFDLYPIYGWCKPEWLPRMGKACDELKNKYAKGTRPLYTWIECCRTSGKWCNNASRGLPDDGPYDYEVKCQIWDAIAQGANAIGYFTHSWEPSYTQFAISTAQGEMLKAEHAKITALSDVLCSADTAKTVTKSAKAVSAGNDGVINIKAKEYLGNIYLIAVNIVNITGAAETQQGTFNVPGLAGGTVAVYGENRSITAAGTSFSDTFTKTDNVHIYVINGSPTTSGNNGTSSNPLVNIKAYPNPFKIEAGRTVKITQISAPDVKVRIHDSIGNIVRELYEKDFNNLGFVQWDGKDTAGNNIPGGVYYYIAEDTSGNRKTGRIAVTK